MLKKSLKSLLNKKTYNYMVSTYNTGRGLFVKNAEPDDSILYPYKLEMIEGKLVCFDLIPKGSTVISGGIGNDVKFELELIKRKEMTIIGIDPTVTAENYIAKEKEKIPELEKFVYLKKALSVTNDDLKLYFGESDFMSSVSSQHRDTKTDNYFVCEAITIQDLINTYQNISYLKLDIEGAEYDILDRIEKFSIPQISIEFHHHCSTEYTIEHTISLIKKIADMGYDVIDYGAFHGRGRKLPVYVSKWSDLNCELLFIKL